VGLQTDPRGSTSFTTPAPPPGRESAHLPLVPHRKARVVGAR
jgi:hypothetical protein